MYYKIIKLKDNLVFIQWLKQPLANNPITHQWVDEIKDLIENAPLPLFFFSDVRRGHVTDIRAIQRLARLTQHDNYGGGVALGNKLAPQVYIKLESELGKNDDAMFYSLETAVSTLERFEPGITANIDWESLLEDSNASKTSRI